MRTFKVAARSKRGQKKPIPFEVELADGTKEVLHIDPDAEDTLALLSGEFMAAEEDKDSKEIAKLSTLMLKALFTEDTYARLRKLLLTKKITNNDLGEFTEGAIEELTGRPTESQSG